jgi:multisubunit Na+/H+ antiporter MnhC subunit
MDMGKVFLFALLGAAVGAVLGIAVSLLVTQNNFRVMFLMTFTEVGVIVGLLGGAKIEDRKSIN